MVNGFNENIGNHISVFKANIIIIFLVERPMYLIVTVNFEEYKV